MTHTWEMTPVVPSRASSPRQRAVAMATSVGLTVFVGITLAAAAGMFGQGRLAVPVLDASPALVAVAVASAVLGVVATWALLGSGARAVAGLAILCVAWLLPVWASWSTLPTSMRAAALAVPPLAVGGLGMLAAGRTPNRGAGRLQLALFALIFAAVSVHVLGYNPVTDPRCIRVCQDAPALLGDVLGSREAFVLSAGLTIVASGVAAALVHRGWSGSPGWGTLGLFGSLAISDGVLIWLMLVWADPATTPGGGADALRILAFDLVVLAILAELIRARRARRAITRIADELEAARTPGELAAAGVLFALPDGGTWVDESGRVVPEPPANARTTLDDEGVAVVHVPATGGADAAALTPANRLSLENAWLRAVVRARIADVEESKQRIATAAEQERHRIRRDLHDGAQQRLVSASLHLGIAQTLLEPEPSEEVDGIRQTVIRGLSRLREIANDDGLVPGRTASSDGPATHKPGTAGG